MVIFKVVTYVNFYITLNISGTDRSGTFVPLGRYKYIGGIPLKKTFVGKIISRIIEFASAKWQLCLCNCITKATSEHRGRKFLPPCSEGCDKNMEYIFNIYNTIYNNNIIF